MKRRQLIGAGFAALTFGPGLARSAPGYPNRAIRWVVPYTAGGVTDTLARVFGQQLQDAWGQTVVVENRAGGATNVASQLVLQAPADGYTLMISSPPLATNPALFGASLAYDPLRDFQQVSHLILNPNALIVRADSPLRSIEDLIRAAKAQPGKVTWGSSGVGTLNHLGGEMFRRTVGVDMTYVPYKGSAPLMQDLLGGTLDVSSDNLPTYVPQIKAGKLRALVVLGPDRIGSVPDVPSMADIGYRDFDATGWSGICVRAGTPPSILEMLSREMMRIARLPAVKARFEDRGFRLVGSTVAEATALLDRDSRRLQALIRELGLKA